MNPSVRFALLLLQAVFAIVATSAFAQTSGSDYTAALPSVEKIEAQIRGTDATDTVARQVAVLNYLPIYIDRIRITRGYRAPFTAGEQKHVTDYSAAANQLTQEFARTHTPDELKAMQKVQGRYEIVNALGWIKQLEGQQAADTYKGAEASLAQSYQEHEEKMQRQMNGEQDSAGGSLFGMSDGSGAAKSPKIRRCLELGGEKLACEGNAMTNVVAGLLFATAGGTDPDAPPPINGVVLSGNYHSRSELAGLSFGAGTATIQDCGTLVADPHNYTVRRSGGAIQFVLDNEPNPIVVTMHPDGTLSGPGPVLVKGRIITGYTTVTRTAMVNGASAQGQGYYCNGPCSTTTSTPNYAPKIERCTIGTMTYMPPKAANTRKTGIGFLDEMSKPATLVPGFRMTGQYADASGMAMDFANDSVVLDCGKAHVKVPYMVEVAPAQFIVRVQNSGGAFALAVAPDNTLRGSGSTSVNGRLLSAIHGDNVSFTPHAETCNVGTLSPRGKQNTMRVTSAPMPALPASYERSAPAAAAAPPAAPVETALAGGGASTTTAGARAPFRVLLSSNFSGSNPLAGQTVFVSRKPMDQILRELGVPVSAHATPVQAVAALQAMCHAPQGCSAVMQKLPSYYVTATKLDTTGKATLRATAATGEYYFFAVVPSNGGTAMWDVPANLVAGDNTVLLTESNEERVR